MCSPGRVSPSGPGTPSTAPGEEGEGGSSFLGGLPYLSNQMVAREVLITFQSKV